MPKASRLGPNVIALGAVSLLTDAASEMILPLLPLFLAVSLGGGAVAVGLIEGAADAVASVLKLVSGRMSDRTGKRKPLTVLGYSLSSFVRPLISLAAAPWHVLFIRVVDRVGKGLRSSPRDALLAGSVAEEDRGFAFGFHRGMDHLGAVIGPLLAILVLWLSGDNLRVVFAAALIPGALAVLVLVLVVREQDSSVAPRAKAPPLHKPSPGLVRVLVPFGIFTLGNASDVFLLLKAGASNAPLTTLPLLWMALHIVKTVTSPLGGRLGDRLGERVVVIIGWAWYAVVYALFAFADSPLAIAALFVVYGVFHGLTEGPERALISKLAPAEERGTAFGWYHLTLGLLALPAGLLFGGLWEVVSPRAAFLTGAGLALVAATTLLVLGRAPRARASAQEP